MIPMMFAYTLIVAPAGWLAGDVLRSQLNDANDEFMEYLPFLCAVFPPLAAVAAILAIATAERN